MGLDEALGKSCNPVFARVAIQKLNQNLLNQYANAFGFNQDLGSDISYKISKAQVPSDTFYLCKTAAGLHTATLNPIHGAALMSSIANGGFIPRPYVIDKIISSKDHTILYKSHPQIVQRSVRNDTAQKLLQMMENTTTIGTARRDFNYKGKQLLPYKVSGKTGTLSGPNPKGVNHWFIGAAPAHDPKIVVSAIVVSDPKTTARAGTISKLVIEKYLKDRSS